ncbi:hypothetical protein [Culicoidibacter larvae]|uniref:Uncharacterized protein n=1 Tax=Culicoidibacter larvae TaxID=2579976 RepID=A0A5R8QJB5_9FIRM|nr:hypothetical protein [Culicoidibacter larvae]TLG77347.1 hypothetical protein FEZ08_01640 [Culicoidibacter larvae]
MSNKKIFVAVLLILSLSILANVYLVMTRGVDPGELSDRATLQEQINELQQQLDDKNATTTTNDAIQVRDGIAAAKDFVYAYYGYSNYDEHQERLKRISNVSPNVQDRINAELALKDVGVSELNIIRASAEPLSETKFRVYIQIHFLMDSPVPVVSEAWVDVTYDGSIWQIADFGLS